MDEQEPGENSSSGKTPPPKKVSGLTLEKAIDLGEYDPQFLASFPQWHAYSHHVQFEFIKQALANRRKQLLRNWMEINRSNDYRLKPHLQQASDSIDKQLAKLTQDKEKLYATYSLSD